MAELTADNIRAWMNVVLKATGWSPRAWAIKAGVAPTTVTRALNPSYKFTTSTKTLNKLAVVANFDPPFAEDVRQIQGDVFHGLTDEQKAEAQRYIEYLRQRRTG